MAERFVKIPMRVFADDMWKARRELSKFEAFIWLLLHKAWEPCDVAFGGKLFGVGVNECVVSVRYLAMQWDWSEKKVRMYLRHLTDTGMIDVRTSDRATIINVGAHQRAHKGHTRGHTKDNDTQAVSEEEGTPKGTQRAHQRAQDIDNIDNIYISTTSTTRARISDEIAEMKKDVPWLEMVCMRFHVAPDVLSGMLTDFEMDCQCRRVDGHESLKDAMAHFVSWCQKRKEKENGQSKFIGYDERREQERQQRLQSYAAFVERIRNSE